MNFYIKTLGCKVNAYESEMIEEQFKKAGYNILSEPVDADVIVINTCTVTNNADSKSRKMIREMKKASKDAIIVVCGCAAENHKDKLDELDIDILIGNYNKSKILEFVEEYKKNHEKISYFKDLRHAEFENMIINHFEGKTRAFVKIQDGCNNFCTYCIIPFTRGSNRSKKLEDAVNEINNLANEGYQEVVLTGIHTGAYGEGEDFDIVDLIREVSKNDNLKRIRISSIEITQLNERFMEEFKNNKKICSQLHVPIQGGSDKILKAMHRKYTKEEFLKKIEEIKSLRDDVNITTDYIVGFPEETDEEHEEAIETLKAMGVSKIHTFPYSKRSGTLASTMKDVDGNVKKQRTKEILRLSDIQEELYYKKFIGKVLEVLVENNNQGFTSNYIKVHLDKDVEPNTFVNAKITKVDGIEVYGEVVE
jgi:threonylcarbamoyladenosine tRNA methylthiotransferase MtaB